MGKDDMYFIRWGNLNPVKHKEARNAPEDAWIHVAPVYKGIYAFPKGYIEPFLLGGEFAKARTKMFKHPDGSMVTEPEFYDEHFENPRPEWAAVMKKLGIKKRDVTDVMIDDNFYMGYMDKPKKFKYEGDIWHHLGDYVDRKDIIYSRHGWVKTTYQAYLEALKKCDVDERFKSYMELSDRHGDPHTMPNMFPKDYYEVFIEKVK